MRIISGKLRGIHLKAPDDLPVRPTTDQAKEALFNILGNSIDLEEITVLDLFAGTGSVSLEFASRGAKSVLSVDKHPGCVRWISTVTARYKLDQVTAKKADVFRFLEQETNSFDLIFADPPYDLPALSSIPGIIKERGLLSPGGILILEHPKFTKLDNQPGFTETRTYGNSSFSFFHTE